MGSQFDCFKMSTTDWIQNPDKFFYKYDLRVGRKVRENTNFVITLCTINFMMTYIKLFQFLFSSFYCSKLLIRSLSIIQREMCNLQS